jgi:hypothetical protein
MSIPGAPSSDAKSESSAGSVPPLSPAQNRAAMQIDDSWFPQRSRYSAAMEGTSTGKATNPYPLRRREILRVVMSTRQTCEFPS